MRVTARADAPVRLLTRHFFLSFFRPGFLDDEGEESFKRAITGVLAATIALGLLLTRVYAGKYASLAGRIPADAFPWLFAADQLFLIALPMFVLTLAMALVSPSIFPDHTDFWALMPLPVSRRAVFAAKFCALFLFASIFIAGAVGGLTLPISLVSGVGTFPYGLFAQLAVSLWASAFTVVGVIAMQGVTTALAPRARYRGYSAAVQTALICSLVLLVPVLARVPGLWRLLREPPVWLLYLPPAWFLGVEQWLLGNHDPFFVRLAALALTGTAAVCAIAAAACIAAYGRFDCAALKGASGVAPARWKIRIRSPFEPPPARSAISAFTSVTLRRSSLHQLVYLAAFMAGASLAVNSMLGAVGLSERWIVRAAVSAPFSIMAGSIVGLRTALLLPAAIRAGWIFRVTEAAPLRRHQLDAVWWSLLSRGVVLPAALGFFVHAGVLGMRGATALLPLVLAIGCAFVEIVCLDWRRIPFTCTFLFAKRPPVYTVILAVTIFWWFVFVSTSMLLAARSSALAWGAVFVALVTLAAALRWYRLRTWGLLPLEFEDYLPDALDTLRLHQ